MTLQRTVRAGLAVERRLFEIASGVIPQRLTLPLALLPLSLLALSVSTALAAEPQATPGGAPLEEVIVTAERTNRALRDTASSVGVLTAQELAARGVQSTNDVLIQIPNVVMNRSANNAPAIRGIDGGGPAIGANAFFAGTRPRIAYQVDGRTLSFNEAIYLDGGIWDAQQVEVYRGPQSTLQGRNAVGGVIAIKTADPTFEWQGKARVQGGNDDLRQYSAAFGGPLVPDVLAVRFSTDHRSEDAFVYTPPYLELDHPERYDLENYRVKLLYTPTPDLRSLNTVAYTDSYSPQTLSVKQPYDDYVVVATATPRFRTRALVGISDTSWQFSDDIALSALVTASDFRVNRYVNKGSGIAQIDATEYTAEPRLVFGQRSDTLSGFLAVFVFDAEQQETIDLFGGGAFDDATLTRAIFGESTWQATDQLELTLGARYESEARDRVGQAGSFIIDYHETFNVFMPKAVAKYSLDDSTDIGVTVGKGYNSGGAGFAFNPPFPSFVYDKEEVWNYEAFVRSTLLDGQLQLTGNLFFNDYEGLQLPFVVAVTEQGAATVIRNAERATTYGVETEAKYRLTPRIDLRASAGVLQTKVNRYDDPFIEGRDLPRAPAFSAALGMTATLTENLRGGFDLRYTDAYYSDVFNDARGKTDAYVLANAQLSYEFANVRVFGQIDNIFDEQTPVLLTPGTTPANDIANMTRPRRVTAGVEVMF